MKETKLKEILEELYKENKKVEPIEKDEVFEKKEFTNLDEEIFEEEVEKIKRYKKGDYYKNN
jgi:hypothetical protein